MKIFVCSPLRGNIEHNLEKARQYCKAVINEGHIPFAPHLIYPQFLDDSIESEREAGINCGLEFLKTCDALWFFGEKITEGMKMECETALKLNIPVRKYDFIRCPECGTEQGALVACVLPFNSYVHQCKKCNYWIGESEWENAKIITKDCDTCHNFVKSGCIYQDWEAK